MVNHYFVEIHPTVLRLVRIVVEEAGKTPVAICGELASQLDSIPTLPKLVPLTHSKRQRSADHIPLPTALRGSPDNNDTYRRCSKPTESVFRHSTNNTRRVRIRLKRSCLPEGIE